MYLKLSHLLSDYHLSIALYFFVSITNDAKKMPKVTTTIVAWGVQNTKNLFCGPGGTGAHQKKRDIPPPITICYYSYNDCNIVLPLLLVLFPPCNFTISPMILLIIEAQVLMLKLNPNPNPTGHAITVNQLIFFRVP